MSVIDIRLSETFPAHPKTFGLEQLLGAKAVLCLLNLWLWAAHNRADGILRDISDQTLEFIAKWQGEKGAFVKTLVALRWLDVHEDGTYELHEWKQHNTWACRKDDRSDATRFSGMAKNYPDLYQQLKEQGATRITSAEYAQLITQYHENEKNKSSSIFLRTLCESHAPIPAPAPAPAPEPLPEKEAESAGTAAADSFSETGKAKNRSAKQRTNSAQAVATKNAVLENIPIRCEYPATAQAVVALWNARLEPAGFAHALLATPQRIKNFKSCTKHIPEAASMNFWHKVLDKILASEYMCSAAKEKAAWTSVDWILSVSNLAKVLEGKYDNDRKPKTTAKKETAQGATVKAETAPKPEQKPIELPAKISELHAKIQAMPELTLEEYLRLKFPEAEEEELHRDYLGEIHKEYYDFPQRWVFDMALETDKACATCTDPKHCKLPEKVKSALRHHTPYLTTAILTDKKSGVKFLGTEYGERIICKHKCVNCPSHVAEQPEKIPADVAEEATQRKEAIPMPAKAEEAPKVANVIPSAKPVDFASALGMKVSFDDKGDIASSPEPKKTSNPGTWEADPYEQEVIERERRMAEFWAYYWKEKDAEEAKSQAENTPDVPENTSDIETSNANDADLWSENEDEYRLYGDTGINGEKEEDGDDDGDIAEE